MQTITGDLRFLSVMAAALETHRQRDMAYCGQYLRDEECRPIAVRMGDYNPTLIENENYIDLNCAMIRKEALDRCGGFDISCRAFEDWELFLRLVEEKAPRSVPVVLSHYTCGRPTSISQSDKDPRSGVDQVDGDPAIARRRADVHC